MKKVDLHIHTSPASYEADFTFGLDALINYVDESSLDIIAITNHNHFNRGQYKEIEAKTNCVVYPGIEVDIEKSHLLVIVSRSSIDDLDEGAKRLSRMIVNENSSITFEQFVELFPNYRDYILIPHLHKNPAMKEETLAKFGKSVLTGEVQSIKKFEIYKKTNEKYVPICFSDIRIIAGMKNKDFYAKSTYIDINSCDFGTLKNGLSDRSKVFSAATKKNSEFAFLDDGSIASTKLNVLIGRRSSGKTYTLDKIYKSKDKNIDNIKYIKQFVLTGQSEESTFKTLIEKESEQQISEYLEPIRKLTDKVIESKDLADDLLIGYLDSLKNFAKNQSLKDAYSQTKIFTEIEFNFHDNLDTRNVINSVIIMLDSDHCEDLITKYIELDSLKKLLSELINIRKIEYKECKLKQSTDSVVKIIKRALTTKSALKPVDSIDLFSIKKEKLVISNFNKIIEFLRKREIIYTLDIHRFKLIIEKDKYSNTQEVKTKLGTKVAIADIFSNNYENAYDYARELKKVGINTTDIYKAFIKFHVNVVNESGNSLSGGERAEYNLLREINNANDYDILLLDEPEASFDNPFLKTYIIDILKDLSQKTTVFISTHNNSLGMLMNPERIIYTEKCNDNIYKVYSGEFGDKVISTPSGHSIHSYDVVIDAMEAGEDAYAVRRQVYESFKN